MESLAISCQSGRPVDEVMPASSCIWGSDAPAGLNTQLRVLAQELLRRGAVSGVLAWAKGSDEIDWLLAESPADIGRICAGGEGYPSLVPLLPRLGGRRTAVVLRPADLWTLEELTANGTVRREDLLIIGQGVSRDKANIAPVEDETRSPSRGEDDQGMAQWPLSVRATLWDSQSAHCMN